MTRSAKHSLSWLFSAVVWTFNAILIRAMYNTAITNGVHPTAWITFMCHVGVYIAIASWAVFIVVSVSWVKENTSFLITHPYIIWFGGMFVWGVAAFLVGLRSGAFPIFIATSTLCFGRGVWGLISQKKR